MRPSQRSSALSDLRLSALRLITQLDYRHREDFGGGLRGVLGEVLRWLAGRIQGAFRGVFSGVSNDLPRHQAPVWGVMHDQILVLTIDRLSLKVWNASEPEHPVSRHCEPRLSRTWAVVEAMFIVTRYHKLTKQLMTPTTQPRHYRSQLSDPRGQTDVFIVCRAHCLSE